MSGDGGVRGDDGGRSDDAERTGDASGRVIAPESRPVHVEGGEPACWLQRVCPDCGALNEQPGGMCWRCGQPLQDEADAPGA